MTGYARGEADYVDRFPRDTRPASIAKDYSVPLHVDCSIEYELPDCAKPPQGVKIEPLLMIHPSHFRRLESLRRVPFVNNLPRTGGGSGVDACGGGGAAAAAVTAGGRRGRRCCRAAPAPAAPMPAPVPAARARLPEEKPRRTHGKHPYLPPELGCELPHHHYERFDKRALQQLPIYM